MSAYLFIQDKRLERENRRRFYAMLLAYHGDKEAVKKQMDQWELEL